MSKTNKIIKKMCVLAGITALAATATAALPIDAQIMIDRALNSPILAVRYSGANAALVELRINGESVGTRSVAATKASGETNFTINLSELKDGDNEVEIRLFDRTGKLVGSDKTNISTEQGNRGPVFLTTPKVGATVQGPVEIQLGFGKDLKNVYVSFFVDNNFKKMSNYPPYNFVWDTSMETNGWHEIEAWAIDETSTTYKTKKTRIFVNNPGGRTDRKGMNLEMSPSKNPIRSGVEGAEAGLKSVPIKTNSKAAGASSAGATPGVSTVTSPNKVKGTTLGGMTGIKPNKAPGVLATGVKHLTPSGTRVAVVPPPRVETQPVPKVVTTTPIVAKQPVPNVVAMTPKVATPPSNVTKSVSNVVAATTMVSITKGQRLPNIGSFAVVLNSQFVNFDVSPRVDNGVPMTPFRHLLEKAGGSVKWENLSKSVKANAEGRDIFIQIGDKNAKINALTVSLEVAPYLERGRTIVPLSFLRDVLNVEIDYDKETGHVLINSVKK